MSTTEYMPVEPKLASPVRRRDSARTKAAILAAAQAAFAVHEESHAGLREIAAAAGVNSTLVRRYFGSKEELFETALADALPVDRLLAGSRERFGVDVVSLFLGESGGPNPLPMMILATADPTARAVAIRLLDCLVISLLARWLGPPDAEVRAAQISIICTGFFTYRKLLPLQPLSDALDPAMHRWLETSLQAVADQTDEKTRDGAA